MGGKVLEQFWSAESNSLAGFVIFQAAVALVVEPYPGYSRANLQSDGRESSEQFLCRKQFLIREASQQVSRKQVSSFAFQLKRVVAFEFARLVLP